MKFLVAFSGLLGLASGFGQLCEQYEGAKGRSSFPQTSQMPNNLRVVFLGDAGSGSQQKEVLTMAKNWNAKYIIHAGDFEYENDAALFEKQLNDVLGPDYPYFGSIGNHDLLQWDPVFGTGHQARLKARLERSGYAANCTGDFGINMACNIDGLYFVLSGVGTRGNNHVDFVNDAFTAHPAIWKFAAWHKNQRQMQIGGKFDETGWDIYDATRSHGAMLVTAHEHSYCRSHIMSDFKNQVIANTNKTLNLKPGESFVFVSGLAGKSIRDWNDKLVSNPWWAAYGASNNGIKDGALFCTFNVDGEARKAHCFFEDTTGKIWDDFDMFSQNSETQVQPRYEPSACASQWIELPISESAGDSIELPTRLDAAPRHEDRYLSFAIGAKVTLQFPALQLKPSAKILQARLQVYGISSDELPADFTLTLRGEDGQVAQERIFWTEEEEDWEAGSVWVSPDLSKALAEVLKAGPKVTLTIEGETGKAFSAFDESPCLAPTLAVEVEMNC